MTHSVGDRGSESAAYMHAAVDPAEARFAAPALARVGEKLMGWAEELEGDAAAAAQNNYRYSSPEQADYDLKAAAVAREIASHISFAVRSARLERPFIAELVNAGRELADAADEFEADVTRGKSNNNRILVAIDALRSAIQSATGER